MLFTKDKNHSVVSVPSTRMNLTDHTNKHQLMLPSADETQHYQYRILSSHNITETGKNINQLC